MAPSPACLLALLLSAAPAGAGEARDATADADAFLREWGEKSRAIRTLKLKFRQEKRLRILRRPRISEGDLVYADRKLSVIVRGRDGEVETELLLRGGELRIHYPRLKKVEVIDVGNGPAPGAGKGPAIPFFAGDPAELGKEHDVRLERAPASGGKPGRDTLILVPRDTASPVRRLVMVFEGFELREYRQVDAGGDEMRMEVISSEVNGDVPESRFEMKLPPGTETVRPAGGSGPRKP